MLGPRICKPKPIIPSHNPAARFNELPSRPKLDVLRVPTVEMPEFIAVDTKFVTQEAAIQMNIDPTTITLSLATNRNKLPYTTPIKITHVPTWTPPQAMAMQSTAPPTIMPIIRPTMPLSTLTIPMPALHSPLQAHRPSAPMLRPTMPMPPPTHPMATMAIAKPAPVKMPYRRPTPPLAPFRQPFLSQTTKLKISTPTFVNTGTITDAPNPRRERSQQTEEDAKVVTAEIAIQCDFDDWPFPDDDAENAENIAPTNGDEQTKTNCEDDATVEERFLQFVAEKTFVYPSGRQECLLCGEMCSNARRMKSHLASHWGPQTLCCHCGLSFENSRRMRRHKCETRRPAGQPLKRIRCPDYQCRVTALSQLELYDHINEHCAWCCYRCVFCNKSFTTLSELRWHKLKPCHSANGSRTPKSNHNNSNKMTDPLPKGADLQCRQLKWRWQRLYRSRVFAVYSPLIRRQVLMKSFLSLRSSKRGTNKRCQICLKYCSNTFKLRNHITRCKRQLLFRKMRKRSAATI